MSETQALQKVRIHINREPYESPNPTTGIALYKLADIGEHQELFREVDGDQEEPPIPRDETEIRLREDEHFYSQKVVEIFVNGTEEFWPKRKISYDQVVKLAFPDGPTGGDVRYSVSWTKPDGQEGSLRPGHSVVVVEKMIFDVRNTDKS